MLSLESSRDDLRKPPNGLNGDTQTVQNGNGNTASEGPTDGLAVPTALATEDETRASREASKLVAAPEPSTQEQGSAPETGRELRTEPGLEVNGKQQEALTVQEGAPQLGDGLRSTSEQDVQTTQEEQSAEAQQILPDKQESASVHQSKDPQREEHQSEDTTTLSEHNTQDRKRMALDEQHSPMAQEPNINGKEQEEVQEQPQTEEHAPPSRVHSKSKRGRPKAQAGNRLSPKPTAVNESEGWRNVQKPTEALEASQDQDGVNKPQDRQPRDKRRRGRPSAASRISPAENNAAEPEQPPSKADTTRDPKTTRGQPGRTLRGHKPRTENVTTNSKPDVQLGSENDTANRSKEAHGSPPRPPKEKRKRRDLATKSNTQNESTLRSAPEEQGASRPETQPEIAATQSEPAAAPETSAVPKRRRGRPSSSSKPDSTRAEPEQNQQAQLEAEETEAPSRRKRPRQPRGNTVPVTVHRLANVAALNATAESTESSSGDEDSADELATRQKTKLPNRGGVNPADVLGQICRETLEKTLNTLKDGIANEANAARRSEITRKRKAVETFGSELEGHVFELSELLDSNYILGTQFRRSKREMVDLRTRLHQVRKEREAVALRIDAVRRKHAEEEDARMVRTARPGRTHDCFAGLVVRQDYYCQS